MPDERLRALRTSICPRISERFSDLDLIFLRKSDSKLFLGRPRKLDRREKLGKSSGKLERSRGKLDATFLHCIRYHRRRAYLIFGFGDRAISENKSINQG